MALSLPAAPGERISQLLPTVKCSTCGAPVNLAELGDHICPPMPPPTPSTPRPSALLAKIRQASQAITIPSPINRSSATSPAPSNRSTTPLSVRSKTPQPRSPSPGTPIIPPPKTPSPAPSISSRRRSSSISRGAPQLPPPQMPPPPVPNAFPLGAGPFPPSRTGTPRISTSSPRPGVSRFDTFPRSAPPSNDGLARHPTEGSRRPSIASFTDNGSVRARVPSAPERPVLPPLNTNQALPSPSLLSPGSVPPRTSLDRPPPQSARPSLDSQRRGSPFGVPTPQTPTLQMGMNRPPEAPVENMAGVGRRGFQAAAHAAMMAASMSRGNTPQIPTPGMDGRRMNAPRHLDINAEMLQRQSSASLSPNTPMSSHSPRSPSPHSPHAFPPPSIASSRTPSPTSVLFPGLNRALSPKSPDTITPDDDRSSTPQNARLSSRYNKKDLEINIAPISSAPGNDVPPSPSDSDYSGSGLAYDQESESVASPRSPPTTALPEKASSTKSRSSNIVQFPLIGSPSTSSVGLPTRSASSASTYSYASRSTARSTGALDTLFEGVRSPPLPTAPLSPANKSPKLPTRSRTTPTMHTKPDAEASRRPKQCTRCNKMIDDGRWVRAEGAGILCERCWKTMYLPKCRRCNRPIEKQAVSSADGQLKGKYHRECFNCHKCQQPFPDKEFYVFDGKPFCRYHYHEANDSLCADPACGQPIEGACAVAHTGERYHPEHLLCEYVFPGPVVPGKPRRRCTERLEEYWEVDGRMLCEKHANIVRPVAEVDEEEEEVAVAVSAGESEEMRDRLTELGVQQAADADMKAQRRRTQFIDIR